MSSPASEQPEPPHEAPPERIPNPWWILPILGRIPIGITREHLSMLGMVALALLFENYDISMMGAALTYIRQDFGLDQAGGAALTSWVRLGALPALALIVYAERIGRRRLFLASIVGSAVATFCTAFTQDAQQFMIAQVFARTFLVTGAATAFVIIAEELPAEHRGWGIGMLGALGATGFGLGAILFALREFLPYGWRALYVVGVIPLLLMPIFSRHIRETRRFEEHRTLHVDHANPLVEFIRPLWKIAREYPGRFLAVTLIGALSAAAHAPVHQLLSDHVHNNLGWENWHFSTMIVGAGLLGIVGNLVAGRAADAVGRRLVASLLFALFPLFAYGVYHGVGWQVAVAFVPLVFFTTGGSTLLRTLSTELFPTSARGTSTGWAMTLETLGAFVALQAVSLLTPEGGTFVTAINQVALVCLGAGLVALLLPETARRELEDISEAD
ncbi:MAG: MFS transporter [Proteobacteria bacterium]|nr:MFS transporter [Pseudomonadota bacterium]